uniref:Uncharacterized protein n=1 Tax=Chromera velia CCMP2878 TaxID=1169474 RepID=A0A0G4GMM8_9ALVE|eukprot:Cvel_22566.t1-p1 / transcript=Cvel_22566.t1 / gene=Cvel_22566 / organism=Chromera_velia_CCMP2878 / gene_product=hypothetical protein / transcript_product=hypothetical protein / location=Cvel_scaffold2230:2715-3161(-) / protein_length=149 / sequence_SO=supercontig / SO=protein_coding / is_pseudo=false
MRRFGLTRERILGHDSNFYLHRPDFANNLEKALEEELAEAKEKGGETSESIVSEVYSLKTVRTETDLHKKDGLRFAAIQATTRLMRMKKVGTARFQSCGEETEALEDPAFIKAKKRIEPLILEGKKGAQNTLNDQEILFGLKHRAKIEI